MSDIHLSIIIPAHNEENRLPNSLRAIDAFLAQQSYAAEVIVVENGSTDRTAELAQAFAAEHPYVRVLQEAARGKGNAVRAGMLAARGAYRFMCDADLSMPIEEVARFLPPRLNGFDVAIGSREISGAQRFNEPALTHLRGRIFSNLVKVFAVRDIEDTQCGFKCFRADIAEDLFTAQQLDGMSFDVELLFIAKRRGYKIVEVPINWYFDSESKVRAIEDSLQMLADVLAIRRNWRSGKYGAPK
ncbi:MAG: dolichyl-phosphate beta-glucosyltransferase [Anaerolineales bacterium]